MTPSELVRDAWSVCETPLGTLTLTAGPAGLRGVSFPGRGGPLDEAARDDGLLAGARRQLDEYFGGRRRRFDLALDLEATVSGGEPLPEVWAGRQLALL